MGLFKKIGNALKKTREAFASKLKTLFGGGELDDDFYEELTDILVSCDVGYVAGEKITDELRQYAKKNKLKHEDEVRSALKQIASKMLSEIECPNIKYPAIFTIIGVNGVGKTTSIGKLAYYFKSQKKDVLMVAGDTFRAAASEQLTQWANRNKVRIVKHQEGADAAAVVYDGIMSAKAKSTDVTIIDTAGRLHTKTNLMEELKKIDKVITREYPEANRYNLIVLDATTGQNALSQIEHFNEYMHIDGIILTKLDGTSKGGIVIPIVNELHVPVVFVGVGEGIDDLRPFDAKEFVDAII